VEGFRRGWRREATYAELENTRVGLIGFYGFRLGFIGWDWFGVRRIGGTIAWKNFIVYKLHRSLLVQGHMIGCILHWIRITNESFKNWQLDGVRCKRLL
jgi:hypothetical protein